MSAPFSKALPGHATLVRGDSKGRSIFQPELCPPGGFVRRLAGEIRSARHPEPRPNGPSAKGRRMRQAALARRRSALTSLGRARSLHRCTTSRPPARVARPISPRSRRTSPRPPCAAILEDRHADKLCPRAIGRSQLPAVQRGAAHMRALRLLHGHMPNLPGSGDDIFQQLRGRIYLIKDMLEKDCG